MPSTRQKSFRDTFKNYLFLSLSGRNDWVSILEPDNRSFFYPAGSISFIPTDAFEALKDFEALDFLKLRAGLSKLTLVHIVCYQLLVKVQDTRITELVDTL